MREREPAPRLVGLYSVVAAGGALVRAPLVAVSHFATADGAAELERGTVWRGRSRRATSPAAC